MVRESLKYVASAAFWLALYYILVGPVLKPGLIGMVLAFFFLASLYFAFDALFVDRAEDVGIGADERERRAKQRAQADPDRQDRTCPVCGEEFETTGEMDGHRQTRHPGLA